MMILLNEGRFRTTTDEWWAMANWNKEHVLTFEDMAALNKYVAKHAIRMYRVVSVESVDLPPKPPGESRLQKPIQVEYDPSNGQHYIFVAQLWFYDTSADVAVSHRPDVQAFASLGAAQAFYAHMAEKGKGWRIENLSKADQCWTLDLAPGNPHGAYQVTIHELLLVKK